MEIINANLQATMNGALFRLVTRLALTITGVTNMGRLVLDPHKFLSFISHDSNVSADADGVGVLTSPWRDICDGQV